MNLLEVANQSQNPQTATASTATMQTRSCAAMMKIKLMDGFKKRAHLMSLLPHLLAGLLPLPVPAPIPRSIGLLSIQAPATPESLSMNMNEDQHDQHDVGFGWEGHAEIELYTDKELEDLLYSNGAAPGGTFILSSGRWSVDQGARAMQEEGKKKLKIDKEFEQFFSMLML
ncbi:uncharacterized protein LOC121792534 [Salvia splendens]|uniref:uncharacterized protein LOC121792534 n=1 Tax=Salvia splendens TaxID=180675 RepID=UPI001C265B08|nr:uncharacterized protein LOC121792534 [Salvia splendens]XP_042046449.1 uncharacterized protein LOC121792534 [Salvia splendens]XP_042046450.1 uncharacterized protein LOC121792534 [Salvia splendens]XP_042046451.1 uncharacterized protein LOC121792534 [Salvia splendens]